jgi:hypothetical protein
MPVRLQDNMLNNPQVMDVWVNGPDDANRLFLCCGAAQLQANVGTTTFTFLIGPQLTRRQFIRAIASGAISRCNLGSTYDIHVTSMDADFDDESGQVEVRVELAISIPSAPIAGAFVNIAYSANILAQFPLVPMEQPLASS